MIRIGRESQCLPYAGFFICTPVEVSLRDTLITECGLVTLGVTLAPCSAGDRGSMCLV